MGRIMYFDYKNVIIWVSLDECENNIVELESLLMRW